MTAYEIYEKYNLPINCKMVEHIIDFFEEGIVDVWFEWDKMFTMSNRKITYRYHRCLNHDEFLTLQKSEEQIWVS